ncbi:MAG: hypothetical protein LUC85_10890 [Bacteroidales bacterium]|nr:hypothetical protein [Bacteroidales bacterium]MCD8395313.1 hypothetical protein [Bacteroidales bacterium]
MKVKALILSILASATLSGCFTGIESTPKITSKDVRREGADAVTAENRYLADIEAFPYDQWKPGKQLMVSDPKIALALSGDADSLQYGDILTFDGFETTRDITGDEVTLFRLINQANDYAFLVYRSSMSPEWLKALPGIDVPFTIDLDIVAAARERLVTKQLYTLTYNWLDEQGRTIRGRKFVPVTVTNVSPGTTDFPIKVEFVDDKGLKGSLMIALSRALQSTRGFETLFSFNDPHLRYPQVSDYMWERITQGRVEDEMTTTEVRLAIGAPQEIVRAPGYGGVRERWIYSDGVYADFENGLLVNFRK